MRALPEPPQVTGRAQARAADSAWSRAPVGARGLLEGFAVRDENVDFLRKRQAAFCLVRPGRAVDAHRSRPRGQRVLLPGAGFDAELVAFRVLHHRVAGVAADHDGAQRL